MAGFQAQTIQQAEPVLSVENLTTSFLVEGEWKPVVRDVSFRVAPGETVAIVGEVGFWQERHVAVDHAAIAARIRAGSKARSCLATAICWRFRKVSMRQVRGNDVSMIFQEPMTSLNPLFHDRRPDFRSTALPFGHVEDRSASRSDPASGKGPHFLPLPRVSTNIRTVFPAACASV